jgi:hypothetical protein
MPINLCSFVNKSILTKYLAQILSKYWLKKKVKLILSDGAAWEDYLLQESKKVREIKTNRQTTDREIDKMVYALYDLTEEEIGIVDG